MIKLGENVYNKIIAQASEAEILGFKDLADDVYTAVKSASIVPEDSNYVYNREELDSDIKKNIWKSALAIIGYHNLTSVDIGKLSEAIDEMSEKVSNTIESKLDVENNIGPQDNLPGVK